MRERIYASRIRSSDRFIAKYARTIRNYQFGHRAFVLVRNSRGDASLAGKSDVRYIGPYLVVHRTERNSYVLCDLDGSMLRFRTAAFRLLPYFARSKININLPEALGKTPTDIETFIDQTLEDPAVSDLEDEDFSDEFPDDLDDLPNNSI